MTFIWIVCFKREMFCDGDARRPGMWIQLKILLPEGIAEYLQKKRELEPEELDWEIFFGSPNDKGARQIL